MLMPRARLGPRNRDSLPKTHRYEFIVRQSNSSGMPTPARHSPQSEAIIAEDPREGHKHSGVLAFGISYVHAISMSARRALAVLPIAGCYDDTVPFPRVWCEGLVAQMRADQAAARAAFISARNEAAKLVAEQPTMQKRFVCSEWLTPLSATKRTQFEKAAVQSSYCQ